MKRTDSLAEVVRRVRNGRAFGPTLSEFLDDFYGQPDRRQTTTASMPWWVPSGSIWHVAGTSLFLAGHDLGLIDAVGGFQSIRIKPPLERDEAKGRDDQDPRRDPASIAHWPPCRTEHRPVSKVGRGRLARPQG